MNDTERVYSLYVQANPIPSSSLLPLTNEAELLTMERSRLVDTQERIEVQRPQRSLVAVVAFAAVLVVVGIAAGITALIADGGDEPVAAADAAPVITFDGASCGYEGPSSIERGLVEFTLINTSDDAFTAVGWILMEPALGEELAALPIGDDMALAPDDPAPPGISSLMAAALAGDSISVSAYMGTGTHLIDCVTSSGGAPDHAWRPASVEVVAP